MILRSDYAEGLQFGTDGLIDLTARGVVGRDDDGVVRVGSVASSNRRDTLLWIGNLRNAALLFQQGDALCDFAARQMLDRLQQFRGFSLTHDLVKLGGLHPGIDQLLEGLARLDSLMLAGVSDEQHAVAGFEFGEEVTDLFRAGETGFIHHVKMTVGVWLAGTDEETL